MRQWLIGLGMLGAATAAHAATWTCIDQTVEMQQKTYFVASRCSAAGTYSTGGDTFGDGSSAGVGSAICGSAQRILRGAMVSNTSNAAGAQTFVAAWDQSSGKVTLATAPATGAPGTPLVQVAAGTTIDGYTIRVLAWCQ
jgi:hypothetical protein